MNSLISLKSINFNLKAVELSSTYNLIAYVVLFFVISNRFFSSVYLELNFAKHLFQNLTSLLALINLIIFVKQRQYYYVNFALIGGVIGLLVKYFSSSSVILFFVSFTLAFSRLNYKYAVYVFIASIFTFTLITFAFFFLELFDEIIYMMRDDSIRETFGFRHPNALGATLFFFCLTVWCACKTHIQNFVAIIINIICILFLQYCVDSRTAQHVLCLLLFVALLYEVAKIYKFQEDKIFANVVVKNLLINSFFLFSIFFILLVIFYTPSINFYSTLNELFSNRLYLCHNAFDKFDLTLFGQKLVLSDNDPFHLSSASAVKFMALDPFCISVLFRNGIVSLVFFALCFALISKKAITHKEYKIAIALTMISLYGLMENMIATISYDIFIFMGMMSFSKVAVNKTTRIESSGR